MEKAHSRTDRWCTRRGEKPRRSDDAITRESPLSFPYSKVWIVPADATAQFIQAGDRYYVPNNTTIVAFVDCDGKRRHLERTADRIAYVYDPYAMALLTASSRAR